LEIQEILQQKRLGPREALEAIKTIFGAFLQLLLEDKATTTWARIIMREQMQPTKAFDLIYERWIRPVHETLSALLAVILRKKVTDPSLILRTHTLVGQMRVLPELDKPETRSPGVAWQCRHPPSQSRVPGKWPHRSQGMPVTVKL
jgi:hypothetical protein